MYRSLNETNKRNIFFSRAVKFKSPEMGTAATSGKRKRAASGSTGSSSSCGSHVTSTADGELRTTGIEYKVIGGSKLFTSYPKINNLSTLHKI